MTKSKPKCVKGTACGYSCISGKYTCSSRVLAREAAALVAASQGTSKMSSSNIAEYTSVELLGEGGFGRAELTDRGTVVKTALPDMYITEDMVKAEYEALQVMHKLSIGPEPLGLSLDKLQIEMTFVKGKSYESLDLKDTDIMSAAKAVLKLHKEGYSHNDLHMGNIIKTDVGGKVAVIDGGTVKKAGDPDGYHGWFDMSALVAKHPVFKPMSKAMAQYEQDYSDDIAKSAGLPFNERELIKGKAKLKLHKAYLSIADKFIK